MAGSVRGARSKAREFALQGLYQWRVAANPVDAIAEQVRQAKGFERADAEHFEALLRGCVSGAEALGGSFAPFLDRAVKELSPVEYSLLLIGAYELTHCLDIPYKVVINEAVELAKRYGGTEGYKYVNGVLDKLAGELRPAEAGPRAAAVRAPRNPLARRTGRNGPRPPGGTVRTLRRRDS